jgi:WD40 repeat protein
MVSTARQVCSFSAGPKVTINELYWSPQLAWSTQGQIAAAGYSNVKAFSAKNCAATFSQSIQENYEASWSPDGKKLATVTAGNGALYVLDNHGNVIAHPTFTQLGSLSVGSAVWSSDSAKLIFVSDESNHQQRVKSVDANGGNAATLMTLPANSGGVILSPDGKYLLLDAFDMKAKSKIFSIWDVNSGKKVWEISSTSGFGPLAFSPDGSMLALGKNGQVQIYATTSGKLLTSFQNNSTLPRGGSTLVWSPDGKYLAESSDVIHIYDVNAQKTVATFGQVDNQHWITTLVWSPDSKGLASSTILLKVDVPADTDNTVNVWKLN